MNNRLRLSILGFCGGIVILMWAGLTYELSFERRSALVQRESENHNLVRLYEEHIRRTLAAAAVTLRQLETEYRRDGRQLDLTRYFDERREELEPYTLLAVIDERGGVLLSTVPMAESVNVGATENFQVHSRNPSRDIFVSKPRIGLVTGKPTIYLSRRMNNPDGSFGGYTVAGISPQYFSRIYDLIDLGADSVVVLLGTDGIIRARRSKVATEEFIGRDISDSGAFKAHTIGTGYADFHELSPVDRIKRLYSARAVKGYPLMVLVGTSESATLAAYEALRRNSLWSAAAASIAVAVFVAVVLRQMSRAARMTEDLRSSEQRYAHVERATNDGIWDRNLLADVAYLSPRGKEILGYRDDELEVGEAGFFQRLHPDDEARVRQALALSKREGSPYRVEYRLKHRDGNYRWILSRGQVIWNEKGEPVRMVGSITDITEHKQVELALEQSERRLRQLLDDMLEGCTLIGFDWTFLYINDAAARGGHKRREDLIGRTVMEAYPGAEKSDLFAAYRRVMEHRKPERLEISYQFENGVIGQYQLSMQPAPEGIFILSLDITEGKESERHIREQARLLDLIFRHSLDSIVLLDKDYNYVRVSESFAYICQRELTAFAGNNHFKLYPSDFERELEPYRREKKIYSRTRRPFIFADHPDWGTTYWDMGCVPILDDTGEIELFLFTLKDVTGQVRAEKRNLDYTTQLKALSGRMLTLQEEERRAVARELHDEIGQGLTAVKIHLQAMEQTCQGCGKPLSTGNLHEALLTAGTILDQVRNLSLNLRPLQLDDLGLAVALRSLVLRDAAAAGWTAHFDESLSGERLDSSLELACYRVAQEALTNVMRHAGATEIRVTIRQSDTELILSVRDDGRGFDAGLDGSGTGAQHLGLLGMTERIRNMAGQFELRTSPGHGTEVRAIFPIVPVVAGTGEFA